MQPVRGAPIGTKFVYVDHHTTQVTPDEVRKGHYVIPGIQCIVTTYPGIKRRAGRF